MRVAKDTETVQAAFVHALFAEAQGVGLDSRVLVDHSGFDPGISADPDARLPRAVYLRLWEAMRAQLDHPAFGLRLGELVDPRQMGVLGSVLLSSETLRDVGRHFVRHAKLLNSLYRVSEQEEADTYTYAYVADCPPEFEREFVETHLAAALTLCRKLAGTEIVPVELRFRHSQPPHVEDYHRLFRAPLRFEQPDNAIVLAERDLDLPVVQRNRYAHELLRRHASMLLEELERQDGLVGRVQTYILETLRTGRTSIEGCATALCMSRRTLHRKLSEEGTSFQALHEAIRRGLAFEYLKQAQVPAVEVAFLLGYSEPSAFHRAFKRWAGRTVTDYRLAAQASPQSLNGGQAGATQP